jgi:hypothetical protein
MGALALLAKYSQKLSAQIGRVARIDYSQLVKQYEGLVATLAAEGGRPASLDVGPPVDASSNVPAVIGNSEWRNNRTW